MRRIQNWQPKMNQSKTESNAIVAKILEDFLIELPIENQKNGEYLDENVENQPNDDSSDEDLSGYASDIEIQTSNDSDVS